MNNHDLLGKFLKKKMELEEVFSNLTKTLEETIQQLEKLNKSIAEANKNHEHTFDMMRHILRCAEKFLLPFPL